MLRIEIPLGLMSAGMKVLNTLGVVGIGGATTVRFATAATRLCPLLVCKAPIGKVLMCRQSQSGEVTLTLTVQEPCAGIEPPTKVTFVAPGVAVTVPPQVLLAFPLTNKSTGN